MKLQNKNNKSRLRNNKSKLQKKQKLDKIIKISVYTVGIGAIIFTVIMILFAALR